VTLSPSSSSSASFVTICRVAQSMESLLKLDLDPATTGRSTAPYGVAHILAAVTVTNNELRAKALAEKDMSVEQYKQLQELQRVKAKDAEGNEFEEKKVPPLAWPALTALTGRRGPRHRDHVPPTHLKNLCIGWHPSDRQVSLHAGLQC
jgi:hypothetical protein